MDDKKPIMAVDVDEANAMKRLERWREGGTRKFNVDSKANGTFKVTISDDRGRTVNATRDGAPAAVNAVLRIWGES